MCHHFLLDGDARLIEHVALVALVQLRYHLHEEKCSGKAILYSVLVLRLGERPQLPVAVSHRGRARHLHDGWEGLLSTKCNVYCKRHATCVSSALGATDTVKRAMSDPVTKP